MSYFLDPDGGAGGSDTNDGACSQAPVLTINKLLSIVHQCNPNDTVQVCVMTPSCWAAQDLDIPESIGPAIFDCCCCSYNCGILDEFGRRQPHGIFSGSGHYCPAGVVSGDCGYTNAYGIYDICTDCVHDYGVYGCCQYYDAGLIGCSHLPMCCHGLLPNGGNPQASGIVSGQGGNYCPCGIYDRCNDQICDHGVYGCGTYYGEGLIGCDCVPMCGHGVLPCNCPAQASGVVSGSGVYCPCGIYDRCNDCVYEHGVYGCGSYASLDFAAACAGGNIACCSIRADTADGLAAGGTFDEAVRNTDPGEANVADGTPYTIRGEAKEGSLPAVAAAAGGMIEAGE